MCDTLCQLGATGSLFAKSSDRPPGEPQLLASMDRRDAGPSLRTQYLDIRDAGSSSGILSQPTWLWGAEHGINEHAVAIGNEKVWTTEQPASATPGLIGMDLVRLGLERARSASEALDVLTTLLGEHGQSGIADQIDNEAYFSSFLIADPMSAWILETSGTTWAAKEVDRAASISNRLSLRDDWTTGSPDLTAGFDLDALRDPLVPTAIADGRLAATQRALRSGRTLDVSSTVAVLRDHGHGPWGGLGEDPSIVDVPPAELGDDFSGMTVCMHIEGYMATTASMVAELVADGPIRVFSAPGSPCVAPYLPAVILDGTSLIPAAAQDLEVWNRFAALRDQVMADPGSLARIRSIVGPLESELIEEAASLGDDPASWRELVTAASLRTVDALAKL